MFFIITNNYKKHVALVVFMLSDEFTVIVWAVGKVGHNNSTFYPGYNSPL